jgi:hypothetical protein
MSSKTRFGQRAEPEAGVSVRALNDHAHPARGRRRGREGENRRQFPRASMDLPVAIVGFGGSPVTVRMLDLSRTGVKLGFKKEAAMAVFRNGAIRPSEVIEAQFRLPETNVIKAKCRVVWSVKADEDEYHIGCEFTQFHKLGYDRIEQYLLHCLSYSTA